ncbi:peptide chain release factor N(5)-glutamine methyltransferase [Solimonas sp. K1W22B-7]|uniref:peptide chain release factor N(5)-glutamine methyltransferase n=1 Tax=Solimonas sp. K1W22B-7 TaxID=2303331 RepID=UPI000E334F4B|nr:peptide chain release factor N(5)-glutamine methyltransferase [Solimonas sp. K1W22B-7]AXQ28605.1 peptide chain release factor N(5)-glutamine methyltransferase [Solimonas sp. K1W22B-7]
MTLSEALAWATARIGAASDSPRQDAEILLAHQLGLSRGQLFTRLREPLRPTDAEAFEEQVALRARQQPVAYLTGEKGFWTLTLKVTPAVLVPRPETELLVEWALECLAASEAPRIADLGTGSGAIALALASELPEALVIATDLSPEALAVARGNAAELGLERVGFREGHWCEPLQGERFDLVVSNPPYIAARDEHLPALRHEPLSALTDGADGLQCLRQIVEDAPALLCPGGWLLLEHGYDQGEAVRGLLRQAGLADIATRRDLGGQERATGGRKP